MKNVTFILFALVAFFTTSTYAQTAKPKVIAVVNNADWCSVCKTHGQRAMGTLMENNKDGAIQYVINDITSAETKKKSDAVLEKAGISSAMKDFKASGVVYFFDATTKSPLAQITVANTNEELAYVVGEVKKATK